MQVIYVCTSKYVVVPAMHVHVCNILRHVLPVRQLITVGTRSMDIACCFKHCLTGAAY